MSLNNLFIKKSIASSIYLLLMLMTLTVISVSFYMEYGQGVRSCPLCFMQRLCACFFCLFCLIGLGLRRATRSMLTLQVLFAGAGLFFALRQVWLQLQPAEVGGICMPGLVQLIDYMSWNTVIKSFVWGSTDCSEIVCSWFGLSMPVWSSAYFGIMLVGSLFVLFYYRRGFK